MEGRREEVTIFWLWSFTVLLISNPAKFYDSKIFGHNFRWFFPQELSKDNRNKTNHIIWIQQITHWQLFQHFVRTRHFGQNNLTFFQFGTQWHHVAMDREGWMLWGGRKGWSVLLLSRSHQSGNIPQKLAGTGTLNTDRLESCVTLVLSTTQRYLQSTNLHAGRIWSFLLMV